MATTVLDKPLFKQMRKGTKSCHECRRRKIKCKYDNEESAFCQECVKYDRHCAKQGYVRDKVLKTRVVKMQTAVDRLQREKVSSEKDGSTQNGEGIFMQLFDNRILSRDMAAKTSLPKTVTSVTFDDEQASDKERLLSTIAGEPYLLNVLDITNAWWTSWRNQHWALRRDATALSLHDYVQSQLVKADVLPVAIGLVCLAMSLTILRPKLDDEYLQLSADPKDLANIILAAIDQIILANAEYLKESDVVLLMLLKAKIHAESNQVRKAWLHMKRAVEIAQTLRLGMPDASRSDSEDLQAEQEFLGGVLEAERFMSMVFGFPYTKDANFSDTLAMRLLEDKSDDLMLKMRALRRVSALAAQHISDREVGDSGHKDHATKSVEKTLRRAYKAMPIEWWDPYQHMTDENAFLSFEILMTQLWFWQVQQFLYIPDLLLSIEETRPAISSESTSCLEAARNVIRIFTILRGIPSISVKVCNCDDFQGVLAGAILLIGIMQRAASVENIDNLQFEQDMIFVDSLKDIFRYRAYEQGGLIAKQGLGVLEGLTAFLHDEEESLNSSSEGLEIKSSAIVLPYFGAIYVRPMTPLRMKGHGASTQDTSSSSMSYSDSITFNTGTSESCEDGDTLQSHTFDRLDQLDWNDWNQFIFDTELSQEWNPSNAACNQYISDL